MALTRSQTSAIKYIASYAKKHKHEANETIDHILRMSNINRQTFGEAINKLKANARVGLHFHPDRPDSSMISVAESLLTQGTYKSQFETLLSNGLVSTLPGGSRDRWEKRIFGGAYQQEGTTNNERPKYGALNLMLHPDGPSPRFGSCYFLLKPEVSVRCTYTYMDSHQDPFEKGTYEEFNMIVAALLEEIFTRDFAIGEKDLTPAKFIDHLLVNLEKPFPNPANQEPSRNLNHYIEAQVHGEISLKEDVEILVADPSFKNTETGRVLEKLCDKYAIALQWHAGFALPVDEVPDDFRGPSMPSLASRVARNDLLTADLIGAAVMDLKRNPDSWSDRGTYHEVLQELKLLWHVLVKYGKPLRNYHLHDESNYGL
ncbi:DUF3626 domain-containing protein [Bacillus sp. B-jedd]|uniref:DUF3626 domain-containing protein n=1 Tax=Bacillus sp. B-jedd TaxID=1476857 RepID=UPI0005155A0F|nr:DUF3626 domain-containing protein [Bacillus sp. B-jedd]CEG27221.1 Hypothetical protein BN1002_02077 [Bacillus sp. B-jedd]